MTISLSDRTHDAHVSGPSRARGRDGLVAIVAAFRPDVPCHVSVTGHTAPARTLRQNRATGAHARARSGRRGPRRRNDTNDGANNGANDDIDAGIGPPLLGDRRARSPRAIPGAA